MNFCVLNDGLLGKKTLDGMGKIKYTEKQDNSVMLRGGGLLGRG